MRKQKGISTMNDSYVRIKNATSGITLIALVVTIIVLLILAGVSIAMLTGENGILTRAQGAVETYRESEERELADLDSIASFIDNFEKDNGSVTNPYDPDGWEFAWVCDNGVWGEKLIRANGDKAEGQIVAKFYKTGNKVTPQFPEDSEIEAINEGDEYHLIIEGKGIVQGLHRVDEESGEEILSGWYKSVLEYFDSENPTEIPIIFYVSKLNVCDGIENVPDFCMAYAFSLKEANLGKNVKNIGIIAFGFSGISNINIPKGVSEIKTVAFGGCYNLTNLKIPYGVEIASDSLTMNCYKLENVTIPNSVKEIEDSAFRGTGLKSVIIPDSVITIYAYAFNRCEKLENVVLGKNVQTIKANSFTGCTSLKSITIPDSVTEIGGAFGECPLEKVKFLTTDASKITIDSDIFERLENPSDNTLAEGSVIYVLSEEMKEKLNGMYDPNKTTVQVVTMEQMNTL